MSTLNYSRNKGVISTVDCRSCIENRGLCIELRITSHESRTPKSQIRNTQYTITGFTLLEVLVAVAILGAALAVLLGAVNKDLILASQSKNLVIASALAQRKLSEIELKGFPEEVEEEGEFTEAPGFKWYSSVTHLGLPGLDTEIRVVRLLITWDEGKKDYEVTLAMSNLK